MPAHQPVTWAMSSTYEATLNGDRLEWLGNQPEHTDGVRVHVTVLEEPRERPIEGGPMAEALEQLAKAGGLSIADPEAWQREQRQERVLPRRTS